VYQQPFLGSLSLINSNWFSVILLQRFNTNKKGLPSHNSSYINTREIKRKEKFEIYYREGTIPFSDSCVICPPVLNDGLGPISSLSRNLV